MESKIRIKLGPIEVEYEGSEAFLKQELPNLIKTVTELSRSANVVEQQEDEKGGGKPKVVKTIQLSTSSIAAKRSCSSGADLVMAAATHLALVKKQILFSRHELLKEMKTATGFFKNTYVNNLSVILKRLLKTDKLTEPSTGNFSLSAKSGREMGEILAS